MKYLKQSKEISREQHIDARVDWFNKARAYNSKNDCY